MLASAESLSGSVRTALGWNATGLVAVAVLLLALALPDAHATFSTPQRVLLPLSLLLNQALICVALRALAAAASAANRFSRAAAASASASTLCVRARPVS